MKFRYKRITPTLIRPIIPVVLIYNGKSIAYEALVDSGADMCVFPAQIGELVGIDIKDGQRGSLGGVIGKSGELYYHDIILSIGGNETRLRAGFTYEKKFDHGFLGQSGIFSIYVVQFYYRKGVIELRPDPKVN